MGDAVENGILYLCMHKRIHEKFGKHGEVRKEILFRLFGEVYHVPKNLRPLVLKEMIEKKMLRPNGNNNSHLLILPLYADPEVEYNKLYAELDFF